MGESYHSFHSFLVPTLCSVVCSTLGCGESHFWVVVLTDFGYSGFPVTHLVIVSGIANGSAQDGTP